uniref:Uncharacterized protein n=1 Tax=Cacopsylla melanoneura TaxID=428564 RepID=A0A8D9A5Z1_9HEMI
MKRTLLRSLGNCLMTICSPSNIFMEPKKKSRGHVSPTTTQPRTTPHPADPTPTHTAPHPMNHPGHHQQHAIPTTSPTHPGRLHHIISPRMIVLGIREQRIRRHHEDIRPQLTSPHDATRTECR